jgi:hypothetical protein
VTWVGYLCLVVSARLDTAFRIPDLLQNTPIILQSLGKVLLLLSHLGEQDAQLVADLGHSIIASFLAPFGQLRRNGQAFAPRRLIGLDGVVFALDDLVQLL